MLCVEEPVAEPDPGSNVAAEPGEAAMWAAMDGLMRFSQASVMERVGVFVRLEAIRTKKQQTRYQPLQPYMDKEAIVKADAAVAAGVDVVRAHAEGARVAEPAVPFQGQQGERRQTMR